MEEFSETTYGERISGVYDEWYSSYDESTVQTLSELAKGGRALELGIGTGRIALPLLHQGIEVHGIDASEDMIAKLRVKPGGSDIPVSLGSFIDVDVESHFDLIFVVFNTFFALQTQDEQTQCFKNVAHRLTPEGVFVIEAFVPNMARFIDRQSVRTVEMDENKVRLDVSQLDMVNQQVTSQHLLLSEDGIRLYPVKLRYAWPSELDLMAKIGGLSLQHRWGNWDREPYTNDSKRHVSVYGHSS